MWNYSFTLPSALILLILVIYYFRRPRLPIRMNRTFLTLLLLDVFTLLADYLSSRVDENFAACSIVTCNVLNLVFFVFYLARIYWFFAYILDVLENHCTLPSWLRRASLVPFALAELITFSSPITGLVFHMDEAGYHSGPLYNLLYICFFFYLIAAALLIVVNRRKLPETVRFGLSGVVLILAIGNIIRYLLPGLLVMNTFCLMALLMIYLSFENPDLFLSDRGSAFNTKGFQLVLAEWGLKRPYRLLSFILRDYSETRSICGGPQMDKCITLINLYLTETYPQCLIFYLRNGAFAIIGPESLDSGKTFQAIAERFQHPWEAGETALMLKPAFVEVDQESKGNSADRVVSTLLLALESAARDEYGEERVMPSSIRAVDRYVAEKRALEQALENDSLEVYLQPLVDAGSGRLVGAEALSRLWDEEGRMIPPSAFIPIAEKDGSIIPLGEQVLRKVCAFLRDNNIHALGLRWVNVNLSPYQCMSRDLAERFGAILKEYRVPAELIHLELTEQSILDYSLLKNQLQALQELGFQFALDDYGSGYSNLTRVKQYPFKNIKMDMEVVWNYFRDRDPLLPTLIQVFKQMHFSITAEGIESKEMAELMTAIGCDYLQGFYFSQPLPIPKFLERYGGGK